MSFIFSKLPCRCWHNNSVYSCHRPKMKWNELKCGSYTSNKSNNETTKQTQKIAQKLAQKCKKKNTFKKRRKHLNIERYCWSLQPTALRGELRLRNINICTPQNLSYSLPQSNIIYILYSYLKAQLSLSFRSLLSFYW